MQDGRPKAVSRRRFLGAAGGSLLFCGAAGPLARLLTGCEVHGEIPRIPGRSRSFITPVEGDLSNDFYIQFGSVTTSVDNHPQLAPQDWSMEINGAVAQSVTVGYDDLMTAAQTEEMLILKTMRCVLDAPDEPLISNGYWRGVPLRHFLAQAAPQDSAARLFITGEDGFESNLRVARVMDNLNPNVPSEVPLLPPLLAYELNGAPIPSVHGGPVRLIVPEKFGFKNMKWPRLIDVTDSDQPFGYYEIELFEGDEKTDQGDITISSIFTAPVNGEAVAGPRITFFGVALLGPGQIEQVEISIDDGQFVGAEIVPLDDILADVRQFFDGVTDQNAAALQAELDEVVRSAVQLNDPAFDDILPSVWSLFRLAVDLAPGSHNARVRAFGTGGAEQSELDSEDADGDDTIRRIRFEVR